MVKRLGLIAEKILHMTVLWLLMDFFLPLWNEVRGLEEAADLGPAQVTTVVFSLGFAGAVVITAPWKALRTAMRSPLVWMLLLWAGISFFWSEAPDLTMRRSVGVGLVAVYALVLRVRFTDQAFMTLVGWALLIALATSVVMVVVTPHWAVMEYPHEGAWNGAFLHKNVLGRIAALGILFFAFLRCTNKHSALWSGALVLAAVTLWKSQSASSLVVVVVLSALGLGLRALPQRRLWKGSTAMVVAMGLATAAFYALLNVDLILQILRRDVTLTGRTPLWAALMPLLREKFWTGYGFRAFWLGWEGPSAEVYRALTWLPEHAHNGFLDLWLELGLVGVLLGAGLVLSPFVFHGRGATQGRPLDLFWVLLGLFVLLYNLPESYFMRPNSVLWLLGVAAAFAPQNQEERS
ncbi:MAG: O-antigen ligase family protein [Desulfosoma sp.]|uniref:O-antigen ligase family protein n=1 Tax=Desulfosoma sp. TaxID=2603217 RepID=UPI00404A6155